MNRASLYAYSGYLTIPHAYFEDGLLGFHFSYIPDNIAIVHRKKSENLIYSATLGFLPFMECYLSIYASPDVRGLGNYGADKTRSPGIKVKLFDEKKYLPAAAVGIFDPDLHKVGLDFTHGHVTSTFVVFSKQVRYLRSNVTLGYGLPEIQGDISRLNGVFGGVSVNVNRNIAFILDYDSEFWSEGISVRWRGCDCALAVVGGEMPVVRVGYVFNLIERKK